MVAVVVVLLTPVMPDILPLPGTGERGGSGEVDLGLEVSVTPKEDRFLVGDVPLSSASRSALRTSVEGVAKREEYLKDGGDTMPAVTVVDGLVGRDGTAPK